MLDKVIFSLMSTCHIRYCLWNKTILSFLQCYGSNLGPPMCYISILPQSYTLSP